MLNQTTIPKGSEAEPACEPAPDATQLPDVLIRWADRLKNRGLGEFGLILGELMKVWGFAGSQLLWMLAPFVTHADVTSVATALESPKTLDALCTYLAGDLEPNDSRGGGR
jgi:hypothetical protein